MTRLPAFVLSLLVAAPAAAAWNDDRIWNDGRAEVAVYDSERVTYGKARTFREHLIVVKEDLRVDTLVKADNPKAQKTIRAFKLNDVIHYNTENYPYSQMASVFVRADDPRRLLKVSVGSQEWCGNTTKRFQSPAGGAGDLTWQSYFDGEADGSVRLDVQPADLFDDQLPLALRGLPFKEGHTAEIRLWESLTSSHGVEPRVSSVTIRVAGEETVRSHAGSIPSWKVLIERPGSEPDIYWFEKAPPHILTRMETADGRKRALYARARWSYWDRRLPRPNILN